MRFEKVSREDKLDPIELARNVSKIVVRGNLRKYYRVARGGDWYGGTATADCCGCNLKCIFCWASSVRDKPDAIGRFYTPEDVFKAMDSIAKKRSYRLVRVSGNEPTIGKEHLIKLIEMVESSNYTFILETNGILIGADRSYAKDLSRFSKIEVRVSLKGCSPEEFSMLTGAIPEAFELQIKALENLLNENVPCHPAVMLSFSSRESLETLKMRLLEIDRSLIDDLEEEYVFLYPHVVKSLKEHGVWPKISYSPSCIPRELI